MENGLLEGMCLVKHRRRAVKKNTLTTLLLLSATLKSQYLEEDQAKPLE